MNRPTPASHVYCKLRFRCADAILLMGRPGASSIQCMDWGDCAKATCCWCMRDIGARNLRICLPHDLILIHDLLPAVSPSSSSWRYALSLLFSVFVNALSPHFHICSIHKPSSFTPFNVAFLPAFAVTLSNSVFSSLAFDPPPLHHFAPLDFSRWMSESGVE